MSSISVIDAFPQFLDFWERSRQLSMDIRIDRWASEYMASWPELLEKQQSDYAEQGYSWKQIALEKVFPHLDRRLPAMKVAHKNLLTTCAPMVRRVQEILGYHGDLIVVIYVGIGCGAGWVTPYSGRPAILFGLENIAECHYHEAQEIAGLVAHELGHVFHFDWRSRHSLDDGKGPWWQLYTEGFAQRVEHLLLGEQTWHMQANSQDSDWPAWCRANRAWLAAEFLSLVDDGEPVRPFFGSWFDLRGHKQTGYFLGHEAIHRLESTMPLMKIALLENEGAELRPILEYFSRH